MTDHHDFSFEDDPLPFEDHHPLPADDHHDFEPVPWEHDDLPEHEFTEFVPQPEVDQPDVAETSEGSESVSDFPPALDVGDLPEPVDGFPWVDAASLGTADFTTPETDPVAAQDLAAYAATDLPPGADGWETLAASDDPAVSALARWWSSEI